ncbi:MAG: 7-cyano-7-deazaguanine synthase QueC [Elusimicrobia bacterium]|nr:7-cyano-7-deazaguanine synthase QueC [Elusimicrobiota bacterium]
MDSAVCLYWAMAKGYDCQALSFDYGQRHRRELGFAERLCRRAGVPRRTVRLRLPWLKTNALNNRRMKIPARKLKVIAADGIPPTYVPGRNTVFLSLAMSLSDATGASAIVIGANALDFSGYPDCRPAFYRAFQRVLMRGSRSAAQGRGIRVLAPLLRLSKAQIVRLGRRLGVPLDTTWSCYAGRARPCGRCDACLLRAKGFREA